MKILHRWSVAVASAAFFIACGPASAQWQVPLGHIPYGKGAGTGFGSVLTYPAGAYGVKCDGVTNDAGALNTAIQTAAVTGGVVQLPIGRCKIGSTVLLAAGVTVKGHGGALALSSVFSGVAAPVYPTSLVWTGGASGVMVDSPAFMQDGSLQDLTIDGGVASGSIGTSALKGVRLRSGFANKFERVSIQNVGIGISIEPNFAGATLALKLTEWNTFSDIRMLLVGDGIDFAANATLPDVAGGAGGVTNNYFYRTVIYGYINYGIKFAAMADDNHFDGGHIAGGSGSVGIIYNSLSAADAVGTYANDFTNFDLEVDDFVGNAYPIIVNNTNGFSSTFKGVIASQGTFFNGVQIAHGGLLTVINNLDPAGPRQQLDANSASGLTMINTNAGSNATTTLTLGTNADNGLAQITANSSTNTSLGGTNSLNISNSAAADIAFWRAGAKSGAFGSSGFTVGNSSLGNALLGTGSATGNPIGISAVGVDTNIQINIAAKGTAAVNVQSPLNANSFNGNTITTGTGTLTLAAGKTLTDTSAIGAKVLLGTTGGGFTGLAGNSCTNQAGTSISNAGVLACSSITNAYLTAGTFSNITGTGTLTAGTAGTGFVVGGVTMTLGSDATGDTYYRNASGILTRLAVGSTGNVLTVSGGLPSWAPPAAAAAGTLTGTTLASNVVSSSLTSVGALAGGSATTGFTIAASNVTWTGTIPLASGGCNANLTASNGGILYSTASACAILAGTATANLPLMSGASGAPTWATVSHPTSAISGGIPYFSSATVMASSAQLASNQLVLGGGAGTAPFTLGSAGTTTTVLHGNAGGAPTFGAVVSADLNITGTTCTNQFVRNISSSAAGTCATVGASDVSLANLTATDTTLTFSGTYNGSTARTIGINLGNANTWTGTQTFGHIIGSGTAPTCSSTGLGTGGTCTLTTGSSDLAGVMRLNTGSSGTGSTGTVTLTLNSALGTHNSICVFQQASDSSVWAGGSTIYPTSNSTTAPTGFWNAGVALTASVTYDINYLCIGS